jgi:hypothetical protein
MARISLYMIGIAAGLAALLTYRNRANSIRASRPDVVPVQKAADMLRNAWADHHTTA